MIHQEHHPKQTVSVDILGEFSKYLSSAEIMDFLTEAETAKPIPQLSECCLPGWALLHRRL